MKTTENVHTGDVHPDAKNGKSLKNFCQILAKCRTQLEATQSKKPQLGVAVIQLFAVIAPKRPTAHTSSRSATWT
jgi:hypothetical protein